MSERWFLDAWCVADGMAFGSLRRPDSIEAKATIYICPPYFEPENVGNIATALAATRGAFQAGFFRSDDEDHAEIAFDSLEELVELVKRAYRSGGATHEPHGGAVPIPPFLPGDGEGGAFFVEELELDEEDHQLWGTLRRLLPGIDPGDGSRGELAEALQSFLAEGSRSWLHGYMVSTFGSFLGPTPDPPDGRLVATATAWFALMKQFGVGFTMHYGDGALRFEGHGWRYEFDLDRSLHGRISEIDRATTFAEQVALIPDLLFRVPVARARRSKSSTEEEGECLPLAPSLGGALCLATGDRLYLRTLRSPAAFMPVAVASLVHAVMSRPRWIRSLDINATIGGAASWLSRHVPSLLLEKNPGEEEIHRMNRRRLQAFWDGRSPTEPTPDATPRGPSGGDEGGGSRAGAREREPRPAPAAEMSRPRPEQAVRHTMAKGTAG